MTTETLIEVLTVLFCALVVLYVLFDIFRPGPPLTVERENEAKEALQALVRKQTRDRDSYAARVGLHLEALKEARLRAAQKPRLEATTNMVKAVLASAQMYRSKWAAEIDAFKIEHPFIFKSKLEFDLKQLTLLRESLAAVEDLLIHALEAAC
jgi:hypothetical protein